MADALQAEMVVADRAILRCGQSVVVRRGVAVACHRPSNRSKIRAIGPLHRARIGHRLPPKRTSTGRFAA